MHITFKCKDTWTIINGSWNYEVILVVHGTVLINATDISFDAPEIMYPHGYS